MKIKLVVDRVSKSFQDSNPYFLRFVDAKTGKGLGSTVISKRFKTLEAAKKAIARASLEG